MDAQVQESMEKYPEDVREMFAALRQMILDCSEAEEKLWARLPGYYVGERFVRLIPFKDHINIEASAAQGHRAALTGYKMTPKGMVQVFSGQKLPREALERIFAETLRGADAPEGGNR